MLSRCLNESILYQPRSDDHDDEYMFAKMATYILSVNRAKCVRARVPIHIYLSTCLYLDTSYTDAL